MNGQTLVAAVTNILLRKVTEQEAMQYALNNFGELAAYIRNRQIESLTASKSNLLIAKTYGTSKKSLTLN